MASRYPEHDIFPKGGIDHRDPSGIEWLANLWRPERANRIAIRQGFGQLTQQDCTAEKANIDAAIASPATGGYLSHMGSFLYNTNFGHRQIISVFEALVQYSESDAPSTTVPTWERAMATVHGATKTAVVSIYDITTGAQWEEVLVVRTSENCRNIDIPTAHGYFETSAGSSTSAPFDFIKFHYHDGAKNAAFKQVGDSVVMMLGNYGVWIYHGIDVAKTKQRLLSSADVSDNNFTGAAFTNGGTNYPTGDCEGSVLQPVEGVRGLNSEKFVYLNKSEFPRADAAALVKGRVVYALRGVLYFSDVGQPGAIMADNFSEIQTEGRITALGEHGGQLFAFTETEAHLLQIQQDTRAGAAFANVVRVSHVRISKRTGCVGPRALVETPFGVCWVSDKGCHMAGAQQSVEDLSDAIQDYWDAGIVDPTTHYYANSGTGGTKTQPDIIYKHAGNPTLAYQPQTESLLVAYDSHILVYQFRHKAWSIWPLGTTLDPTTATATTNNLVSSYLPATQTGALWPDSTDSNPMTGNLAAPPVFDGTEYYSIGNPANLQLSNNFSIEAWASQDPDASQGYERLISRDDGGQRCFAMSQNDVNGNPYAAIFVGGAFKSANGTNNYADGLWHHYMATHDGLVLRLYVDGALEATAVTGGPMDNDPVPWQVGRYEGGGGGDYLEGRCDTVRFYNVTLTASEILQNYNAGKLAHGGDPGPQNRQTTNCLEVLSDSLGTYLVGGLLDKNEDGVSPAAQSTSYYITEFERGGALDRSCKDEDSRRYGSGRFTYAIDPSALYVLNNGFLWSLEKPTSITTNNQKTKIIYEFPVYLRAFRPAIWPGGGTSIAFDISWNSAFTFEGLGVSIESSPRSSWTIATPTATSLTTVRSTLTALAPLLPSCKLPMFTLRLSANNGVSARTDFVVSSARVWDSTGAGSWQITRALIWQQQHLYAPSLMSTNNRLSSSVEWGYKTGQIGLNEGKELRVRGINTIMETTTSQSSQLYNSFTVSDYKRLSGQYPDYTNMTPGNRRQEKTDLLRERMTGGRRVFNSLARWAPVTSPSTIYLIDSPELNSIVTSVSARGEHVSVGMYGFATDKADALSMHRMSIAVLDTGNRRRKGR